MHQSLFLLNRSSEQVSDMRSSQMFIMTPARGDMMAIGIEGPYASPQKLQESHSELMKLSQDILNRNRLPPFPLLGERTEPMVPVEEINSQVTRS